MSRLRRRATEWAWETVAAHGTADDAGVVHVPFTQADLAAKAGWARTDGRISRYLTELGDAVVDRRNGLSFDVGRLEALERTTLVSRRAAEVEERLAVEFGRPAADGTTVLVVEDHDSPRPPLVSEMAERVGLSRSTTHRHLRALESSGRVARAGRPAPEPRARRTGAGNGTGARYQAGGPDGLTDLDLIELLLDQADALSELLAETRAALRLLIAERDDLASYDQPSVAPVVDDGSEPDGSVTQPAVVVTRFARQRDAGADDPRGTSGVRTARAADSQLARGVRTGRADLEGKKDQRSISNCSELPNSRVQPRDGSHLARGTRGSPFAPGARDRAGPDAPPPLAEHAPAGPSADEAVSAVRPLVEECQRRGLPSVLDRRGIDALLGRPLPELTGAVTEVLAQLRAGRAITSPLGLLVRQAGDPASPYFRPGRVEPHRRPAARWERTCAECDGTGLVEAAPDRFAPCPACHAPPPQPEDP